jgi:hypothetical protein
MILSALKNRHATSEYQGYLLTRFQRWHVPHLGDPAAGFSTFAQDFGMLQSLEAAPNNWTMFSGGEPIASGGTLELWPGRSVAWAHLGVVTAEHMLAITREAYRCVRRPQGRVEMTVRMDFPAGHRWAAMLGFKVETACLENYDPDGTDHVGYVLVNRR